MTEKPVDVSAADFVSDVHTTSLDQYLLPLQGSQSQAPTFTQILHGRHDPVSSQSYYSDLLSHSECNLANASCQHVHMQHTQKWHLCSIFSTEFTEGFLFKLQWCLLPIHAPTLFFSMRSRYHLHRGSLVTCGWRVRDWALTCEKHENYPPPHENFNICSIIHTWTEWHFVYWACCELKQ